MLKAQTIDLRVRLAAALTSGTSHPEATELYGVSVVGFSCWCDQNRTPRSVPKGVGDLRSGRIDAHKELIVQWSWSQRTSPAGIVLGLD